MQNNGFNLQEKVEKLASSGGGRWRLDGCGVTRSERQIPALVHGDAYVTETDRTRVLLIGGLSGDQEDTNIAIQAVQSYIDGGEQAAKDIALSAVPCGNPDGLALGASHSNGAGGNPLVGYPPSGHYYGDPHNPESRYLWRWISFMAPDVVIEVRIGTGMRWEHSGPISRVAKALNAYPMSESDSLLSALSNGNPNGLAPIPCLQLTCSAEALPEEIGKLWAIFAQESILGSSPARQALDARRSRTPLEVARILNSPYGHKLNPVIYTQGVAISGRLRLALLDPDGEDPVPDIERLVRGYAALNTLEEVFGEDDSGSNLAGLVWADELSDATGNKQYNELLLKTANLYKTQRGAVPAPSDPEFRCEDMFFSGALLGRAYKITGDESYVDIQSRFLLEAGVQRSDGLFWHDRTAAYYWGRGNGFAALGYAETLSYMPRNYVDRGGLRRAHTKHLEALQKLQQPSGMWLQVMNLPGSYQEMSATCMIGYAMARGMRRGWLDESFKDSLMLAWQGVNERIDDEGGLVDVCTGTGVQTSTRDYLDRGAIFGLDDRGGSLGIWFATEMERYLREPTPKM